VAGDAAFVEVQATELLLGVWYAEVLLAQARRLDI
jgi:hypothetical protein